MEDRTPGDIGKKEGKERVKMPELEDVEPVMMGESEGVDPLGGDTTEIIPEGDVASDQEEPPVEELFPEDEDSDAL